MIFASQVDTDLGFVKRTIAENKLDPRPLPNFAAMPGAYDETDRWRRVVERYGWGAILFLSDKADDDHFTVVAVGEFDLRHGTIVSQGQVEHLPITWYGDLASHFRPLEKTGNAIPVPACLGHHDSHPTCDGGYNGKGRFEQPCAWRERCILIQGACAKAQILPGQMLKGKTAEEIVKMTTDLKKTATPVEAPAAAEAPAVAASTSGTEDTETEAAASTVETGEAEPKKSKKRSKPAEPKAPRDLSLATTLYSKLMEHLAEKVAPAGRGFFTGEEGEGEPAAGDIVIADRFASSEYMSVYCKPAAGRKLALFSVRFRGQGLVIQLPVPVESELLASLPLETEGVEAPLTRNAWKDGMWLSAVKGIADEARVATVFEIISAVLDTLGLPDKTAATEAAPATAETTA